MPWAAAVTSQTHLCQPAVPRAEHAGPWLSGRSQCGFISPKGANSACGCTHPLRSTSADVMEEKKEEDNQALVALEGREFSIRGITPACRDARARNDRSARPQLQRSHRAGRRETPSTPVCNPSLILPEKSSKSTGSPANMWRRGEIPPVLSGGRNGICAASAEVQPG